MISAIHHTGLTVSNLEPALVFYRDVLGLKVVMEQEKSGGYLADITGYPGVTVRMAHLATSAGQRLELFEYVRPLGRATTSEPRDIGITHVCLVVESVHDVFERLVATDARPFSEPIAIDTGANSGAFGLYVRDPDGIILELFQPAPA